MSKYLSAISQAPTPQETKTTSVPAYGNPEVYLERIMKKNLSNHMFKRGHGSVLYPELPYFRVYMSDFSKSHKIAEAVAELWNKKYTHKAKKDHHGVNFPNPFYCGYYPWTIPKELQEERREHDKKFAELFDPAFEAVEKALVKCQWTGIGNLN